MKKTLLVERDVTIPMRDTILLYADIYRLPAEKPRPTLLARTPYGKGFSETAFALFAAEQGYNVVIQDTRGRWASEGDSYPFKHEKNDGLDSINWIAGQSWSDGQIGMFGMSYLGYTQFAAASMQPAGLKTIIPNVAFNDTFRFLFPGGAVNLGAALSWSVMSGAQMAIFREPLTNAEKLPLMDQFIEVTNRLSSGNLFRHQPLTDMPLVGRGGIAPYFADYLDNRANPSYWQPMDCSFDHLNIPALHIGGWYDLFINETTRAFSYLTSRQQAPQKMIIGPWVHGSFDGLAGEVDFGYQAWPATVLPEEIQLRWFDYWLKGEQNGIVEEPPVKIFVMGDNIWRDENEWPLRRAVYTRFFLHSSGAANSLSGDGMLSRCDPGEEPTDSFLYDPRKPVPTRGGGLCCWNPALAPGAFDQRQVEQRPDILVYTSRPLDEDLEVTGVVKLILWASSSALETDFTAKLVDVEPCGYARNIQDGILRTRYRNPDDPSFLKPGQVYEFTIDLSATSNVFKAGHRVRLEISSSNFPRFDRNLNTGDPTRSLKSGLPAYQMIFHDSSHPSHLWLPIIPKL